MGSRYWLGQRERLLALAASAPLLVACAASEGPGPAARAPGAEAPAAVPAEIRLQRTNPPADLGAVERYAWLAVIQLGEAWETGDVEGFLGRVSRGFYRGYPALESALRTLADGTTARRAVAAVREVATDGERVSVRAQWEFSLVQRDGARRQGSGETVFLFLRSDTSLRLLDYRGDGPFGIQVP